MKKILSNFAESLISRGQMKSVKGGCGTGVSCRVISYGGPGGNSGAMGGPISCMDAYLIVEEMRRRNDGYQYDYFQD